MSTPDTDSGGGSSEAQDMDRRTFVTSVSSLAMAGGLVSGYGAFACVAGRYLYPARGQRVVWLFVKEVDRFKTGDSLTYRTPSGATVAIARQGEGGTAEDFVALSNICPHLGCKVEWQPQNDRFFCPCHNGVFDPSGKPVAGPPFEAGQSLLRFPLKIEGGLLYIQVPAAGESVAADQRGRA